MSLAPAAAMRGIAIVLLLTALELAVLYVIERGDLSDFAWNAHLLTLGYPPWRVFQNRVLAPFAVRFVAELTGVPFGAAFVGALWLLICAGNLLAYLVFRRLGDERQALFRTTALIVLFVFCQRHLIYLWDPVDVIVSLGLIHAALAQARLRWFCLLYCVAVLNRESAGFIGLWLVMDGIARLRGLGPRSMARLAAGLVMVAATPIITEFLRSKLFVDSTNVEGIAPYVWPEYGPRYHFTLFRNLRELLKAFSPARYFLPIEAWAFLILLLLLFYDRVRWGEARTRTLALVAAAQAITLPLLAVVTELRVFDSVLPYAVLFFGSSPPRPAVPEQPVEDRALGRGVHDAGEEVVPG